jgi:hypothetical protein
MVGKTTVLQPLLCRFITVMRHEIIVTIILAGPNLITMTRNDRKAGQQLVIVLQEKNKDDDPLLIILLAYVPRCYQK